MNTKKSFLHKVVSVTSISLGLLTMLLSSCNLVSFTDDENPSVEGVMLNNQMENIQVEAPGFLQFDGFFQDNDGVDSMSIIVTPLFESPSDILISTTPFSFADTFNIGGQRSSIREEIELPNEISSGNYQFDLAFQDNIGLTGTPQTLEFSVTNQLPFITLFSPNSADFSVASNQTFFVSGDVDYQFGYLDSVRVALESNTTVFEQLFIRSDSTIISNTLAFDLELILDTLGVEAGEYTLAISAYDSVEEISATLETSIIIE